MNVDDVPDLLKKAVEFATRKHEGMKRKNKKADEYIVHPVEVMHFLQKHGIVDPDILSAAVLHDTIEDTSATYEELKRWFGRRVADFVQEVSDDKSKPKLERKKLQLDQMGKKSFGARMIKLGDKWSNTKDLWRDPPVHWSDREVRGYMVWSERVCDQALSVGDAPVELEDAILNHFCQLGVAEFPEDTLEEYYRSLKGDHLH